MAYDHGKPHASVHHGEEHHDAHAEEGNHDEAQRAHLVHARLHYESLEINLSPNMCQARASPGPVLMSPKPSIAMVTGSGKRKPVKKAGKANKEREDSGG